MSNNSSPVGTTYRAYSVEKWMELRSEATTFLQEVAVSITPFSGLSSNALAHLRSDWITWKDDFVTIRVPITDECNQWKLIGGIGGMPTIVTRESICSHCRKHGSVDGFENLWDGFGDSGPRPYTANLHRDIAEPAIEMLTKIFKNQGRSEISATPNGIQGAVNKLVNEDQAIYSYSKLLRTGVSLYTHYGLDRATIAELTPYTARNVKNIEASTPEIKRKYNNSYTYLRAVENTEPATLSTLAEVLEISTPTVSRGLKKLEEEGRVEADRSEIEYTWHTIGNWKAPFDCDTCGYKSVTLRGIRRHKLTHK